MTEELCILTWLPYLHFLTPSKLLFLNSQLGVSNRVGDSYGPRVARVKGELCPKNFIISKWGLKKNSKIHWFLQFKPGSYFLVSDTCVAVTAEPNLPWITFRHNLSFVVICSNTRSLTFCHHISTSSHPLEEKKNKKQISPLIVKHNHLLLHLAFNTAVISSPFSPQWSSQRWLPLAVLVWLLFARNICSTKGCF